MSERIKKLNRKDIVDMLIDRAIFVILFALLVVIIVINPEFVSVTNLRNILSQSSTRIIFALGVGTIIVTQGTDLSLGRQVGLAAVISASLLQAVDYSARMYPNLVELPLFLPIVLVMIITALISLFNGFVVAKLKVDPFIATLGMMIIVYGITSIYVDRPPLGAQPIGGLSDKFKVFAQGSVDQLSFVFIIWLIGMIALFLFNNRSKIKYEFFVALALLWSAFAMIAKQLNWIQGGISIFVNIPHLVIFAGIAILIMWFLWNQTKFGKNIFAIGGNSEAAIVSGVNVTMYLLLAYTIAGLLYGFGGALEAARIGSATNNTGNMYELDAIAACIVGGLSFSGGVGRISGIVAGVLIFQVIAYGLTFIGVNPYFQYIIKGAIIITAVAIDNRKHIKKK